MADCLKKRNYLQFPFYNKKYKTKTVRRYYIDKITFSITAIFSKLVKLKPYIAILLFYDVNLKAIFGKIPTLFRFKKKYVLFLNLI